MTPKEKAKELVERFSEYSHTEFISYRGGYQLDTQIQNAKQCATIAVNEIIEATKQVVDRPDFNGIVFNTYWQEVKAEIQAP
jgi:hypothetical protein